MKKITRRIDTMMVNADVIDRNTRETEVIAVELECDTKDVKKEIETMYPDKVVINYEVCNVVKKYAMSVNKFMANADEITE